MLNAQKRSQGEQCIGWLLAAGQLGCILKAASPSKGRLFERDADKKTLEIARIHLGCEPPGPRDTKVVVRGWLARAAQLCLATVLCPHPQRIPPTHNMCQDPGDPAPAAAAHPPGTAGTGAATQEIQLLESQP